VSHGAAGLERRLVTIGTGGLIGLYHPIGGAICRLVDRERTRHGLRCTVESTGGSIYNLETVRSGELDFGVARSDAVHHALSGTARFAGAVPFEALRTVFAAHAEPFTVIVRGDSDIDTFAELAGRRIGTGESGAGARQITERVLEAHGMSFADFSEVVEIRGPETTQALCEGEIDALILVAGHPVAALNALSNTCRVALVGIEGPEIERLVAAHAYYRATVAPGGLYKGLDDDSPTFGVWTNVITSASQSADVVYRVTRAVFEDLEEFRRLHPSFLSLEASTMVGASRVAPLHEGARRYYAERGWPMR